MDWPNARPVKVGYVQFLMKVQRDPLEVQTVLLCESIHALVGRFILLCHAPFSNPTSAIRRRLFPRPVTAREAWQ